ncbi:hybrid signal transduction histidine kinase M [Tanacetum coccineum]
MLISSPHVLLTETDANSRRGNGRNNRTSHRSYEPLVWFNCAKGFCRFGGTCKFLHDNSKSTVATPNNNDNASLWSATTRPIPIVPQTGPSLNTY